MKPGEWKSLRAKSVRLTGYLEFLLNRIGSDRFTVITPGDDNARGCQLSILAHNQPKELFQKLERRRGPMRFPGTERDPGRAHAALQHLSRSVAVRRHSGGEPQKTGVAVKDGEESAMRADGFSAFLLTLRPDIGIIAVQTSLMRNEAEEVHAKREHIKSAKELRVYKLAYELATEIFEATKSFPSEEKYALTGQIRRSFRSV